MYLVCNTCGIAKDISICEQCCKEQVENAYHKKIFISCQDNLSLSEVLIAIDSISSVEVRGNNTNAVVKSGGKTYAISKADMFRMLEYIRVIK